MHNGTAGIVYTHFEKITDTRVNRGSNQDLHEMVFMALTATICEADGRADLERFAMAKCDCFGKFIAMESGVPSHDTFLPESPAH